MINLFVAGIALFTVGQGAQPTKAQPNSLYDFTMQDIDGKNVPLKTFKGAVALVVNVASKCGNTPQYEQLEAIFEKYHPQKFVVLGFPANDFRSQEPGTNAEIKEFCTSTYHVKFPMFSKIVVKGDGINPLYQWLISSVEPKTDIDWNFAKFLVGRDGKVIKRFPAKTRPDDPEVIAAIESALQSK